MVFYRNYAAPHPQRTRAGVHTCFYEYRHAYRLVQAIAQRKTVWMSSAISLLMLMGQGYGLFQINNQAHPDYKFVEGDVMGNAAIAERQLNLTAARADELECSHNTEKFILAGYNQGQNSIPVINGVPQFNA